MTDHDHKRRIVVEALGWIQIRKVNQQIAWYRGLYENYTEVDTLPAYDIPHDEGGPPDGLWEMLAFLDRFTNGDGVELHTCDMGWCCATITGTTGSVTPHRAVFEAIVEVLKDE